VVRTPLTKIVAIGGPTATGKTAVSVRLAQRLARAGHAGEIVNADSTQVYRGMDIGTAKPSAEERADVPHHLFDIRNPDEQLSAAEWAKLADEAIAQIVARGHVPIVVGGTGFYFRALLEGLFEAPEVDPAVRARIEKELQTPEGLAAVRARLEAADPESARAIHYNDRFRSQRALEIYESSGRTMSALRAEHARGKGARRYEAFYAALELPRELLYEKINARQEAQVKAGLLEEYRSLLAKGYSPELRTLNGLCYRHMRFVHEGKMTLEEAIDLDRQDNRHYAKRQFTWFRGVPEIRWYDSRTDEERFMRDAFSFLAIPMRD
jgi:tRNA dimethylallyltransferase